MKICVAMLDETLFLFISMVQITGAMSKYIFKVAVA